MTNGSTANTLGILVGGGPAPGINSVISSATIEARNSGLRVIGIYDGFEHLIEGSTEHVRELQIEDVSRIHCSGRLHPAHVARQPHEEPRSAADAWSGRCANWVLRTCSRSAATTRRSPPRPSPSSAAGALRVAHVPKTIDNDLPMPSGMPTFGYETARHVGTELVLTIMEESRTINRWFIVV